MRKSDEADAFVEIQSFRANDSVCGAAFCRPASESGIGKCRAL